MNQLADDLRAAPSPGSDEAIAKMAEALEAALAWIDAVPADTPLPAMPGFDRDDVDAVLALHRGDAR